MLDAALAAKGQSRAGTRAGEPHTASTRRWLWATTRCPGAPQPPRRCSANDPHPYTRCTVTAALCMPRDVRPPPGSLTPPPSHLEPHHFTTSSSAPFLPQ